MQAIKRTIKCEENVYETRKELIKECIRDLERERTRKEEGKGKEEERERARMRKEQIKNEKEAGNQKILKNILERLEKERKEKKHQKVNGSRYNNNYKTIITEKFPKYLVGRKKR